MQCQKRVKDHVHVLAVPEVLDGRKDGRTIFKEPELVRRGRRAWRVRVILVLVWVITRVAIVLPGALRFFGSPAVVGRDSAVSSVPYHADVVSKMNMLSAGAQVVCVDKYSHAMYHLFVLVKDTELKPSEGGTLIVAPQDEGLDPVGEALLGNPRSQ